MKTIWNRIDSWLAANAPEILNNLQPGATHEAIKAAEQFLEIEFTEDVKSSYRIHNGQLEERYSVMPYWQFLCLEGMIGEWNSWKELLDTADFKEEDGNDYGCASDGLIRTELWWNPKWIPIASNLSGDSLCLDLDPAPGGQVGQIIFMCHDDGYRGFIAKSLREWLEQLATDLEAGKYKFKKTSFYLKKQNE
ncbi:SMI1/KNR4 family protein [Microcoleus vaginatus]|uniref:SMI1/KNR4 family protein n=1 Tax=Microcoleus vaginatus TaxID=119532 RepID=UPI0032ACB740